MEHSGISGVGIHCNQINIFGDSVVISGLPFFRYNFERLCNKMNRATRLINFEEPIKEAYFSKLDSLVASRTWPPRVGNQKLQNVKRELDQITVDLDDLKRWRDRIYDAIHSGIVRRVRRGRK